MCVAESAIAATTLAISAVATTASIGFGVYSAQQQQQQIANAERARQVQQQQQVANAIRAQNQQQAAQTQALKQQQEQANLQVQQANQSILTQYEQQVRATKAERESIVSRYAADKLGYQRSKEQADKQYGLNAEALNTAYMQEQTKLKEVRQKAAFESQAALAKSIGMKGKILASGRKGQSVGLLVKDVERQSGFEIAAQEASVDSAKDAAGISMDQAFNQAESANAQAASKIGFNPQKPYLPEMPGSPNFVDPIGLSI
tara:strand:- start:627 stop:1406 length:780 start_codon:yes stop_codon:yes gene_type:complete